MTVEHMTITASNSTTSKIGAEFRRATRAASVMACALGVLQGCSGADAVAPVSQGKTPVAPPAVTFTTPVPPISGLLFVAVGA